MKSTKAILIGGTGRSGTNLLKNIFANRSDCAALPFEHRFTIDPEGIVDFYNTYPTIWSPFLADSRIKRFESFLSGLAEVSAEKLKRTNQAKDLDPTGLNLTPPPYSGWELEKWIPGYKSYVAELVSALIEFDYHAVWPGAKEGSEHNMMAFAPSHTKASLIPILVKFIERCYHSICESQNKAVFVEDNTHNILFASDLLTLIPNSKLVHVIRNPKDVVASLTSQRWAPRDTVKAIRWYETVMGQWESQKSRIPIDSVIEIKLEDLIHDPTLELSRLCDFLQLDFQRSMLEIELDKSKIGIWRNHPDADLLNNSKVLKQAVDRYHYQ